MNRIIKFRAWHKQRKWMYQVGYMTFDSKGRISRTAEFNKVHTHEFKEIELMQFTGLLDKNGTEIYEGDILSCNSIKIEGLFSSPDTCVVKFYADCAQFVFEPLIGKVKLVHFIAIDGCVSQEVIGNIYSNPELLKEREDE